MGHQKDVKESAYSQISAKIQYRRENEETKSQPRSRAVPIKQQEAEK